MVWDIETVPDIKGFAAANGHDGRGVDEVRAAMGDKFPKHIYHSIICIGALIGHQDGGQWTIDALGAPHHSLIALRNCRRNWSRSTVRRSTFQSCDIAPWCMEWQRLDRSRVRTSIGTPKMQSISATFCLRSAPRAR
jgi:hypothetical protein